MKYTAETYAKALLGAMKGEHDAKAMMQKFLRIVEKNGDMQRIEKIFSAIEKEVAKKAGGSVVVIETAREMKPADMRKLEAEFKAHDRVKTSINPALIAGVRITVDGERELDNSLAKKIQELFV